MTGHPYIPCTLRETFLFVRFFERMEHRA